MDFAFIRKSLRRLSWSAPRRDPKHRLGRRGERAAAKYLKRHRYRVLLRNYRCPAGEIDLICSQGDTLVFVEVKTRSHDEAQDPQEGFRKVQWRRVENAARFFLMRGPLQARPARFDLVTVVWPPGGEPTIEHFEDVFQPRRP